MDIGARNDLDDLTGKSFGLLTAVERAPNDVFGTVYWRCVCRCGEVCLRRANTLRAGKFFTCGAPACRFWEKVYIPKNDLGGDLCWEWTAALSEKTKGYGVFKKPGTKTVLRAHVFSWELHNGSIEKGLWVLHKCDNRKCVRPDHLFLGDHDANMEDMAKKGRACVGKIFLSKEVKQKMMVDYQQGGVTHADLAERFGVSLQTVGRTLRRESN